MTQTKAELLQTRHQGDIRLGDADSTHYVGFKAPATVGTSLVWTLPATDGTANYLLKTDGSGNLGWVADSSTDSTKMPLAGGTFTGNTLYNDGVRAQFGTGNDIVVQAGQQGIRFLLIAGAPIQEPIAWHGPIVMNTQEELRQAFNELNNGTFIK